MNTAVLTRRIDPTQPLADASNLLMAASNLVKATAPTATRTTSRHARRFKRDQSGQVQGATSHFRRRLTPSFSLARAPVMTRTNLRMASTMLMSPATSMRGPTPQVSILNMSRMRARAEMIRTQAHRRAKMLEGTLRARFAANALDWHSDHKRDLSRMAVAQGRFANSRGLTPDMRI